MSSGHHHALNVCRLFKNILLLHRRLPPDMKAIGDEYVKAEFRKYKKITIEETRHFMQEWENYAALLQEQLFQAKSSGTPVIGQDLSDEKLETLSSQHIEQLCELRKEMVKPSPFLPPENIS